MMRHAFPEGIAFPRGFQHSTHTDMSRKIRYGMVGGGRDAFIGAVHRIAARIDDQYELVAGAFSSNPEKALASAQDLGVPRAYTSFAEMAAKESRRKDGIDAVAGTAQDGAVARLWLPAAPESGLPAVAAVPADAAPLEMATPIQAASI